MINSVYGKKMENLTKRIGVKIVNTEKDFVKHVRNQPLLNEKSLINVMLLFMK